MAKRIAAVFCFLPLLGIVGCVGQSSYEKKVDEATSLSRELAELQRQNSTLTRDNEGLRADIAGLRLKVAELDTTRKRLEQTISSGEQSPYQFVAELEREKGQLRDDLAKVLRTQDDRVRTSRRIYERCLDGLKDEIASGQVRITELRGTIRIELLEEAFFDGTKTDLSVQGKILLRKVAELVKASTDVDASVESYYEIPPVRLSSSVNHPGLWRVPLLRSLSVARFMMQSGVGPATLSALTQGTFGLDSHSELVTDSVRSSGIDILIVVKE
ncbi:MAG: hypothetical protein WCA04_12865 [Geobacteraceae bacterium]